MAFGNWEDALHTAVRIAGERATSTKTVQLIVIDELPFLMAHSPEIPGVLQMLYDTYGPTLGGGHPAVRIIICGSALSVMSRLLSETKALYGRAILNICLEQFNHVESAEFWGIEDPETALRLHAIVGGVPGYKELTATPPPGSWPTSTLGWPQRCSTRRTRCWPSPAVLFSRTGFQDDLVAGTRHDVSLVGLSDMYGR
ncbi:MAG TPA: hypothetical protein VE465_05520 [Streptosporangiaceae bacterium]|jgi:hypothetical protein|nr:hypothetical protein [Streptosporangiaceae bacterium]